MSEQCSRQQSLVHYFISLVLSLSLLQTALASALPNNAAAVAAATPASNNANANAAVANAKAEASAVSGSAVANAQAVAASNSAVALGQAAVPSMNFNGTYHIPGRGVSSNMTQQEAVKKSLVKHGLPADDIPLVRRASNSSAGPAAETSTIGEYVVTLSIGNQSLDAVFDTGSYSTWVKGFEPSDLYVKDGETISNAYHDGSIANATILLGTVSLGPMTVISQAFGLFTTGSAPTPGTLGMSFDTMFSTDILGTSFSQFCFFANLQMDSVLRDPVFVVDLAGPTADFWFGGIPDSVTNPVYTSLYGGPDGLGWPLQIASYAVGNGNHSASAPSRNANPSSCKWWDADTGTTLLVVDASVAETYFAAVPGAHNTSEGWTYPCATALPDLLLYAVDGAEIAIQGAYLGSVPDENAVCYGRLAGVSAGCILGQPLFESNVVVFDHGNKRVGFVAKG